MTSHQARKVSRERALIEATVQVIQEEGLHRTTFIRVGRRAGVSPGLVAHYFGDKAGLLQATFRHLARELGEEFRRSAARAGTPHERLAALIDANFAKSQSSPEVVSAWLAFWGQVNYRPELARIQRVVTGRMRSNLRYSLRALVPEAQAQRIATGLSALIDGLWLRAMLATGGIEISEARSLAHDYLDTQLSANRSSDA